MILCRAVDRVVTYTSSWHESGCVVGATVNTCYVPEGVLVPQPPIDEWRIETSFGHLFCVELSRQNGGMISAFNLTYPLPVDVNGTSLRDRKIDCIRGYPYFDIDPNRCSTASGATSNSLRRIFEVDAIYSISVTGADSVLIEFDSPPVAAVEVGGDLSLGISGNASLVAVEFTNPGDKTLGLLKQFRR